MLTTISESDLPAIKASLRKAHPDTKPSHRMEAFAAGLGFTTYAGLRAALAEGPIPTEPDDSVYYAQLEVFDAHGVRNPQRALSRAICRIPLCRVLDEHTDLTLRGFDSIWQGSRDELALPMPVREAKFAERRREAYDDDWSVDQFELAMVFLSRQKKIKSLNRKTGSYGLKHRAEGISRHFDLFTHLGNYVSNGMLIAAAYASGYIVRRVQYDSYNAFFNISMQTVRLARGHEGRSREGCKEIVADMYGEEQLRRAA